MGKVFPTLANRDVRDKDRNPEDDRDTLDTLFTEGFQALEEDGDGADGQDNRQDGTDKDEQGAPSGSNSWPSKCGSSSVLSGWIWSLWTK